MLEVRALSFDYFEAPLLSCLNCSLAAGKLLHLQGANGAGKSTLLRLLAGILLPKEGQILWQQTDIHEDLSSYQAKLAYVGHKLGLDLGLTVYENCYFDPHWQAKSSDWHALVAALDLQGLEHQFCYQLSEGQKRRVALLRVLMGQATLWLLDEPYASLDENSSDLLTQCLMRHLGGGGLVVMSSHLGLPSEIGPYEVCRL